MTNREILQAEFPLVAFKFDDHFPQAITRAHIDAYHIFLSVYYICDLTEMSPRCVWINKSFSRNCFPNLSEIQP